MLACAWIWMVENDKKRTKIIQNILFCHAYERLMLGLHRKMKKNKVFLLLTTQTHTIRREPWDLPHKFHLYLIIDIFFYHFRPCKRMRKHVFTGQNTQHSSTKVFIVSNFPPICWILDLVCCKSLKMSEENNSKVLEPGAVIRPSLTSETAALIIEKLYGLKATNLKEYVR